MATSCSFRSSAHTRAFPRRTPALLWSTNAQTARGNFAPSFPVQRLPSRRRSVGRRLFLGKMASVRACRCGRFAKAAEGRANSKLTLSKLGILKSEVTSNPHSAYLERLERAPRHTREEFWAAGTRKGSRGGKSPHKLKQPKLPHKTNTSTRGRKTQSVRNTHHPTQAHA